MRAAIVFRQALCAGSGAQRWICQPKRATLATLAMRGGAHVHSATVGDPPSDPFAKFAEGLMRCNQKCFERVANDIAWNLPADATVLDLGASAGEPSLTIASRSKGLKVVSTDFAAPNLEIGTKRAAALGLSDQVEFHTTDAQDLSHWADDSFDAVTGTYVLMFPPDLDKVCREVRRVLKPGGPFLTTVWQAAPTVDIFGAGLMKMVMTMREAGSLPMPDPDGPPPTNPCNLSNSVPNGKLGDALRAAGFSDVSVEEWAYPICIAGTDPTDVATRYIEGTPFYNEILEFGGEPLLAEAVGVLVKIFEEAGHEMVDLATHVPQWSGVDNPDGLTKGMLFKTNTCLYITCT